MLAKRIRTWAPLVAGVLSILAIDQVSKWLVRENLALGEFWAPIPALAQVFTITHVQNTGVAFGQLAGIGWLFMLVNIAVFVGIVIYYPRLLPGQWTLRLASILIAAGSIGNPIDRIRMARLISRETGSLWTALPRASVTDMFDFHIWPVFNVSDLCVVTGVCIVAFMLWREERAREGTKVGAVQDQAAIAADELPTAHDD